MLPFYFLPVPFHPEADAGGACLTFLPLHKHSNLSEDLAMMMMATECDVPAPGISGTGIFSFFWWYRNKLVMEKVSEPVSDKFGTGKSLGTGIGEI